MIKMLRKMVIYSYDMCLLFGKLSILGQEGGLLEMLFLFMILHSLSHTSS